MSDKTPFADEDAVLDALDLDSPKVRGYLQSQGWHEEDDCPECERDHCDDGLCACGEEPEILGATTDSGVTELARAFEHLHKLAHPGESPHLSFCKAEPCRSLPWAVVNEIAKVA